MRLYTLLLATSLAGFAGLIGCISRTQAQDAPSVTPHVVVVQFEAGVDFSGKTTTTGLQAFDRKAAAYGVHTIERIYPFLDHVEPTPRTRDNLVALRRTYYVRYSAEVAPYSVSRDLALAPGVVYAEPIPVNRTHGSVHGESVDPNDPGFRRQTELHHLKLPQAWDVVKSSDGSPAVVIAIVDGGGEWRHEDLQANVWTNAGEIPGNGLDDDNNGLIDDVHGVNYANGDDQSHDPTGLSATPENALHGTAVAGVASAVTDNDLGISGAAWNAQLMHINAGDPSRDGIIRYGYEGILYAAANGADIINTSWSGVVELRDEPAVRHIHQVLDLATDLGALVVAAAGNSAFLHVTHDATRTRAYPAGHPRVLSVGATQKENRVKAEFSNYGRLINVFAPGVDLLTTGSNDSYVSISGTSFSSPLVAGVAALVKTRFPDLSPDALREQIRLTSETMDAENPPSLAGQLGRGFVNAAAAIEEPARPAVRLQHWDWEDDDGDDRIAPGDVVRITMSVVNHLVDANQLWIELVEAEPYSFIEWTTSGVEIGDLARDDSTEVVFEFTATSETPANQRVQFFTRVRTGAFDDTADQVRLSLHQQLAPIHRALSAFYVATGGEEWDQNDHWDPTRVPTEEELAMWRGVTLDEGGLLSALDLKDNALTGLLPVELGNLASLRRLDLGDNAISGGILPELSNLDQLQWLDLEDNSFSGEIPVDLGKLERLQYLDLKGNALSGEIPPELGDLESLQYLSLNSNALSGKIPVELGKLDQLQSLHLRSNSLSGPIPPELGNLPQLQWLTLSGNPLFGGIPPEFGNLHQLQRLYLSGDSLSGEIPPELGNLESLQFLSLINNSLSGEIPTELGNLERLRELVLAYNALSGEIPQELGKLERLQRLRLDFNALSGEIPPELGNLHQLGALLLSANALSGAIPPELGSLQTLLNLQLSGNTLSGEIPVELGNLQHLQRLGLSSNALSGAIPPELGNLHQLQRLQLGDNTLSGEIPPELGNLSQLTSLDMGDNNLTGRLPSELGNLLQLTWLHVADNNLTGQLPRSLMQLEHLRFFSFGGQALCAPADEEFQRWLERIRTWAGPTCRGLHFAGDVSDQSFPLGQPIAPLVLPEAINGRAPVVYTLTPALPPGLVYDASTRTIRGTPTRVTSSPVVLTYKATDAIRLMNSLVFSMEVFAPLAAEQEALPASFTLHGNYPNPFRGSTSLVVDLPWPATLSVEVFDVMGRRVQVRSPVDLPPGWAHSLRLNGAVLPSGLYVYRVLARSPEGLQTRAGRFLRVR